MLYMYHVHVIVYANKDDDYYYYYLNGTNYMGTLVYADAITIACSSRRDLNKMLLLLYYRKTYMYQGN